MEHKVLIIGGGIAAVLVLGVVAVKMRANSQAQSSSAQTDTSVPGSYFSGTIPSSVGYSTSDAQTVSDPANSGSTATGGGFDITSLLQAVAGSQAINAASQIQANVHTSDSQVLAGINLGATGGTATVTHSDAGTTVAVQKGGDVYDQILNQTYHDYLGRDPDPEGAAFWKNALETPGYSVSHLQQEFKDSAEYKKLHPAA